MGGSGGGFSTGNVDFGELYDKLREVQNDTERKSFESGVADVISSFLGSSQRDVDAINKHLDEIRAALGSDIEGTVDFRFGGSVAKHTYVDGLSDVDTLLILNNSDLVQGSPDAALDYTLDRLQGRFPKTPITKGKLAVTLEFGDVSVQILPAVKTADGTMIPRTAGSGWRVIQPEKFRKLLTSENENMGGKLVPTVKLARSVMSSFPENRRLSGYHVESLALSIFDKYKGPLDYRAILKRFFREASVSVLQPVRDVTGQSGFVDSDLGKANSLRRKQISGSLQAVERRMENADTACSVQQWREVLGGL